MRAKQWLVKGLKCWISQESSRAKAMAGKGAQVLDFTRVIAGQSIGLRTGGKWARRVLKATSPKSTDVSWV